MATHGHYRHAQYAGTDDAEGSEIAVVVGDAWQRQGLGYHLLGTLLEVAAENGIERIQADVLADNHAMRHLATKLGCRIRTNPHAPFLVQVTKTLAQEAYGRDTGLAPCLGTPAPESMSPGMRIG
jgi:acetyltransferase